MTYSYKINTPTKTIRALVKKNNELSYGALLLGLMTIVALIAFLNIGVTSAKADPLPQVNEKWSTDFTKRNIPFGDVLSGGPPKDGIPSIDEPKFINITEATHLQDVEPVIGFEHNGEAKAYPLQVMTWHEIVNDKVGGHAFAVTYCPLCNAAIVFDAVLDGKVHDFGTTGRLRKSDLLMYDRQTESWWQQFSGESVIGEYTGKKLKISPSRLESWASFKKRFPNGKVLVPNNPNMRSYGDNPYANYDERNAPYPLYKGTLPTNINPMARVIVLRRDGAPVSILTLDRVRMLETVEQDGFALSWKAGQASALNNRKIAKGKDVGNLIVTEMENGIRKDAAHDITFAFVAHAFHPEMNIIQ